MATLEKIRNRAGILVAVVIGMALIAFILGDLLNSGSVFVSDSQFEIAEIEGQSISYQEFQRDVEELIEINKFSSGQSALDETAYERIREQIWQETLRENILDDDYEDLGIAVSSEELWDLVQGDNIHPIIQQLFTNRETGMVNTQAIIQFLKRYNQDPTGQQQAYWLFIEDQIIKDRKFTKYTNLIQKGLYATEKQGEAELPNMQRVASVDFVYKNFNAIADSAIEISESDLKSYYNENKEDFKQSASRDIEYVTFDVKPSKADREAAEKWINNIKEEFAEVNDDADFLSLRSDIPFNPINYSKKDLPQEYADAMFSKEVGYVYGPYFEDETYKLAKLSSINYVPDSVKARHILLEPSNQQEAMEKQALADSLKNLIENGASFSELAREYSDDRASAVDGGNLGWFKEGEMVKPFSDSCFYSEEGDVKLVNTNYGFHIVQVLEQSRKERKVQVAVLGRKLLPSTETYRQTFARASKFVGNHQNYDSFLKGIEESELTKRVANNIQENDKTLASFDNPREFIRGIFSVDEEELIKSQNNPIFEIGDRFVVGFVTKVREEGYAPIAEVKAQIMVNLRREKKAEKISADFEAGLKKAETIEDLAALEGLKIYQANNISFRSFSMPNVGVEPKVIATAAYMEEGSISYPIKGNNGVYVLAATDVSVAETGSAKMQQVTINSQYQNRINYELFEALKEEAEVVDKRAKFY